MVMADDGADLLDDFRVHVILLQDILCDCGAFRFLEARRRRRVFHFGFRNPDVVEDCSSRHDNRIGAAGRQYFLREIERSQRMIDAFAVAAEYVIHPRDQFFLEGDTVKALLGIPAPERA